jgi:hypothetical protein
VADQGDHNPLCFVVECIQHPTIPNAEAEQPAPTPRQGLVPQARGIRSQPPKALDDPPSGGFVEAGQVVLSILGADERVRFSVIQT